ncbi:MAG: HlyD family efflux transporter periplasmic adaptor subunit [Actinobacteria bacterium]|uniref:Multidrug resistance protein MdtA-like barrel-sandwich hybrid domain-containing protein n=1 Tax=Nostocoides veronense TaxID=330836 RepID=A0ABP4YEJ2_9MICO|nr:HlyD family efflux transporter periplasmic adaptor subunit [Actinomycetota bacterium]
MKFRFKALERQRQPDQLDSPLLLASPRGWVAVFTVLITTVMIGLWGFLGSIPRYADASGLLTFAGGIVTVESDVAGALVDLPVTMGQQIHQGQQLGTVRGRGGEDNRIISPASGRVVSVASALGNYVAPGEPLVQLERVGVDDLEMGATLIVSGDMVPYVHPSQEVTLAVPGVNPRAFGRLKGVVESVSEYPVSAQQLATVTGQSSPAGEPVGENRHLVTIRLLPDSTTVSGYQWTSVSGPPVRLQSRTPVSGALSLGGIKPVSILLGV